jgi:alpha,alpha-trehalase
MKKLLFLFVLLSDLVSAQPQSPRLRYPGLFEAVQLGQIYPDGKTFPDLVPLKDPALIRRAYAAEKNQPGFNLKSFTDRYFQLPGSQARAYQSGANTSIRAHIDTLWSVLYRRPEVNAGQTSLLALPEPYVVPGGRFREVYYWDSYFTMLGLQESGHVALIHSMVDNFAYLIRQYGFIPNGNRSYYLTRSQPPFFSLMVQLLSEEEGELVYLNNLDVMKKEYQFWMRGSEATKAGKAFQHVTTDLAAVDLNALMYNLELSIAKGCELQGDTTQANVFKQKAASRKLAIRKYFWNAKQGWFVDYNWKKMQPASSMTLAGLYPLFFNLASPEQAKSVAAVTERDFLKASGLVTTLSRTSQQWDAPNAWAPLQWIGIEGLRKYGFNKLSDTIGRRWVDLNLSVFKQTGKLMEKYNVIDKDVKAGGGEYPSQDGFGWTNGVLLKLLNRYKIN